MPSAGNIAGIIMNPMLKSLDTVQSAAEAEAQNRASSSLAPDQSRQGADLASGFTSAPDSSTSDSAPNSVSASSSSVAAQMQQNSTTNASADRTSYASFVGPQSTAAAVAMGAPPSTWSRDDRGFAMPLAATSSTSSSGVTGAYASMYSRQAQFGAGNGTGDAQSSMFPPMTYDQAGAGAVSGVGYSGLPGLGGTIGGNGMGFNDQGYSTMGQTRGGDVIMPLGTDGGWTINPDLSLSGMDFE